MVGQRRSSRSCSILIWGGFLLLYTALTAIIDCTTLSNGTSTTDVPLSSTDKQFSSTISTNTDNSYGSSDGQTIPMTSSSFPNEIITTESPSVKITFKKIIYNITYLSLLFFNFDN